MGCKAAVQALQKADFLKAKVVRKCDLLNDSQAWTDQQQLQMIYHQVLVLDLEYALDKKVEQELWTVGFKNHITTLQEQARDKKNPHRSESQVLLSWCLEAASGFYLTLLEELCMAFDLNLPFQKHVPIFSQTKPLTSEQLNPPQTSSCIYICQYCLVHLGDIARYRNQRRQAESFYKHAILLSPTSGQPYNQLALLEASQGDKLATIFYYVQGIAVKNPFPVATTNLSNTLSLALDKDDPITEIYTKLSINEFVRVFVKVHGLLYLATDLNQAEICVKSLNATLTPLVATQSFTELRLIQMTVINLYALKHTVGAGTLKTEELTTDEITVRKLVLDLLAGSLNAFLLPVYTLNHDRTILDYYALSAIKFILYWLQKEPDVLKEDVFKNRLQIWPGLCKLLNSLQVHVKDFDYTKYITIPLSEDKDLQGFLPLGETFKELDFKTDTHEENSETEKFIRAKRLIEFGRWLTTYEVNGTKLITMRESSEAPASFEPGCVQPDPTIKLLEEMKSFNVTETRPFQKSKSTEKKGGILKPQGSLEKSRKEQDSMLLPDTNINNSQANYNASLNKNDTNKLKRVSQNVALQSIFKKMEENKQVKFHVDTVEKEKLPKVESKPSATKQLPNVPYLNQQFPTDASYNQNIATATNDLHQDYFKNQFQNYSNTSYDRNNISSATFPKTETALPRNDLNKTSQNVNFSLPPKQHMFTPPSNMQNVTTPSTTYSKNIQHQQQSQIGQHIPMQYQNANHFPQSRDFNAWKPEERPPPNWWPNSGSNFQQRDYQVNFPYSNNFPQYAHNTVDFNKQHNNQTANTLSPTWNPPPGNHGSVHFDHSHQGLSLRQAMLKETKNIAPVQNTGNASRDTSEKMQPPSNTPGYSLFNSNSWSPSLPGQFRSSDSPSDNLMHNLRQQPMFSQQASLQQLLETQNQLKKGDS